MKGIERHIEILLLSNDCVIIPGFGGFTAHYVAARYDDTDGMFLPPMRTIGFNPQLVMNDSLLAQSYAEYYDISYPEALQRIEEEVEVLRRTIQSEGRYELHGIGTLSNNEEGNLEFEPFESGLLTPHLYGLSGFEMLPLAESRANDRQEETAKDGNNAEDGQKAHTVALVTRNEQGERVVNLNIPVTALRNIAAAAITIIAFFLIPAPAPETPAHAPVNHTESSVLPSAIMQSRNTAAPVVSKPAAGTNPATTDNDRRAAKEQATAKAQQAATSWCLVICSHVGKDNAEALTAAMRGEGFADTRVHQGTESIKVVYGHYATQEEAYAALKTLRTNAHFKDSWVLEL